MELPRKVRVLCYHHIFRYVGNYIKIVILRLIPNV